MIKQQKKNFFIENQMYLQINEINYDSPQVEKLFLVNGGKYQDILAGKISLSDVQFVCDFDWTISKQGWMRPYTGLNNTGSTYSALEVMPIMTPAQMEAFRQTSKKIGEVEKETSTLTLEEKQKAIELIYLES